MNRLHIVVLRQVRSKLFPKPASHEAAALTSRHSSNAFRTSIAQTPYFPAHVQSIHSTKMSTFSNADTGSKTADPYVAKNLQEHDLKTKVTDLLNFADKQKFCMMTTVMSNGLLASRCMALAGKVRWFIPAFPLLLQGRPGFGSAAFFTKNNTGSHLPGVNVYFTLWPDDGLITP